LPTYAFSDFELTDAVERLLADGDLRDRLADIGVAIRDRNGLRVGADVIEQVGVRHQASVA
jgi:UDP:flavonoid glycosyltransferase YjiC (YdhE family)